jgi:hypothetical protein
MIQVIEGLPDSVVGLEAVGKVESADYEAVAAPAVQHALERHAKIRVLHVLDKAGGSVGLRRARHALIVERRRPRLRLGLGGSIQGGEIPHAPEWDSPGSRRTSPSPLTNAFGAQVIGSTARLRRSTSGSPSPVKIIRYG